jgi:hypothetical protein
MANIPRRKAVLMHDAVPGYTPWQWYIGHKPQIPEVPYCYYKLFTNVIKVPLVVLVVAPVCLSTLSLRFPVSVTTLDTVCERANRKHLLW